MRHCYYLRERNKFKFFLTMAKRAPHPLTQSPFSLKTRCLYPLVLPYLHPCALFPTHGLYPGLGNNRRKKRLEEIAQLFDLPGAALGPLPGCPSPLPAHSKSH